MCARSQLEDLFRLAFAAKELAAFLRQLPDGEALAEDLLLDHSGHATLACQAARLLHRRRRIDPELLAALRAALPGRGAEIDALSAASAAEETLPLILDTGMAPWEPTASPLRLLLPGHAIVPWAGREAEMAELDAWADSPEPLAIRLVHGPSGVGKTRLAQEWLLRRRETGHRAAFLRGPLDGSVAPSLPREGPIVVAVDDAELRPGLGDFLEVLAEARPDRVRVLLLSREIGAWWDALMLRSGRLREQLDRYSALAYLDAPIRPEDRAAEFQRAATAFADRLGHAPPLRIPRLGNPDVGPILHVHVAALAAVLGLEGDDPVEALLDREVRALADAAGGARLSRRSRRALERQMRHLLAALTLRGELDESALPGLLAALDLPRRVSGDLLRRLTPPAADGRIASIEPMAIGEALVAQVLLEPHRPGDLLEWMMRDAPTESWARAFAVFGWVVEASDHPVGDLVRPILVAALQRHPERMRAAFIGIQTTTRDRWVVPFSPCYKVLRGQADLALARDLDGRVPERWWDMDPFADWTERALLAELGPGQEDDPERARRLVALGAARADRHANLAFLEEAVAIYRRLATDRPDVFLPGLAESLERLGRRGSEEDALAAAEEVAGIYQRLAELRPDAFLREQAHSLRVLWSMYPKLGRIPASKAAVARALALYQRHAARHPEVPALHLAHLLESLGRADEAVAIHRRIAAGRPEPGLDALHGALKRLATKCAEEGRHAAALAATTEALAASRRLAALHIYGGSACYDLLDLGTQYAALDRHADALAAAVEAVKLQRTDHERYLSWGCDGLALAHSLDALGTRYAALGQHEEALGASAEATDLRRRHALRKPEEGLPGLMASLLDLSGRYAMLGREGEANAAAAQARVAARQLLSRLRRRIRGHEKWAFETRLHALEGLKHRCEEAGWADEARTATAALIGPLRQIVTRQPDLYYIHHLASNLNKLAFDTAAHGRLREARAAATEAVAIYRRLAAGHPERHLAGLANALETLGSILLGAGQAAAAVPVLAESARLFAPLALQKPTPLGPLLQLVVEEYSRACAQAGLAPDADILGGARDR